MSTARRLYQSLHGTSAPATADKRLVLRVPGRVTGMGRLIWIEVARNGKVEQWHFDQPEPRLVFEALTDTARGRSSLWILGGSYKVDARGFRTTRGPSRMRDLGLAATSATHPDLVDRYQRTHGWQKPVEALRAQLPAASELVPIGDLYAVTYDADKGDGEYPYRHPFEVDAQPVVCCDPSGTQLFLVGGRYTVTPHGIEDSE